MSVVDFLSGLKKSNISFFSRSYNTAVILAAGTGTRMSGSKTTKQLITLGDRPLICRTIETFQQSEEVNEIIIVALKDEIPLYDDFIKKYSFTKVSKVISGGETRQDSVFLGIKSCGKKADYIIIHDGARCFVTQKNISDVLKAAKAYGCAIAADTSSDTIKLSTSAGFIKETVDRSHVYRAQTPQIFKSDIIIAAYYYAAKNGYKGTDDASLVEKLGINIKLVDCGHKNIKVTYNDDLDYAEFLIEREDND